MLPVEIVSVTPMTSVLFQPGVQSRLLSPSNRALVICQAKRARTVLQCIDKILWAVHSNNRFSNNMYLFPLIFLPIITVSDLNSISIEASPAKPRNTKPIDLIQPSLKESPYWEYILREFVFKTISSPPQFNNVLYKKLLEAPFYSGPLPTPSNEDNALLSRGDVYHLPDGRWILCQEGCENCKPCTYQKDSLVKWTLKRIKRFVSSNSYRYDLQLTVEPQREVSLANFGAGRNLYIPNQLNPSELSTSTQESHIDRSRSRSWRRLQRDQNGQLDRHEVIIETEEPPTVNSNVELLLNSFQNNFTKVNNIEPTHRLIMGFDQLGNKHIIHILSTNLPDKSVVNFNDENDQSVKDAIKFSKVNLNPRKSPYQMYIQKILDSIYTHRPFIEAFLTRHDFNEKIENNTNFFVSKLLQNS